MTSVGVALVGAGPWGTTLGRAVTRVPSADLRWICELDPDRRSRASAIHPLARLTDDLGEVLDDPLVVAALVAVDSPRHHAVGRQVLEADRHLLVEKPMALSTADATDLHKTAEARNRVLAVGHLLLHHPAVKRTRELVTDGVVGKVLWLEAARLAGPGHRDVSAWWTLAPHDVSLALYLFDATPTHVTAVGGPGRGAGAESVVWATLHFADGRLAHVHAARQAGRKQRGFSIVGTQRALTFDELAAEDALQVHDPAGARQVESLPVAPVDALTAQCRSFVAGVASGDTTAGNSAHALTVVRVLEAGARSIAAGGAPIDVV
ncbi:MAG TPA: Gfo/Idh/MocA family oxidoreductase [Polyangia bacterium]|nr:Gfo/Idh/MocA family oxidoreductase [Polyangia bacterium]